MKSKILLGAVLLMFSAIFMQVNAQLEVQTSGDVKISKHVAVNGATVSDSVALRIIATPTVPSGTHWGVYATTEGNSFPTIQTGCNVGVVGQVKSLPLTNPGRPSLPIFYAGIAGVASFGVGIYGSSGTSLPKSWNYGNYAGYFNGNVKVTGNITASNISKSSDQRLLSNITYLNGRNGIDILSNIHPVSYTLPANNEDVDSHDVSAVHYGFVAQELLQIAPELVLEDGAGFLSIDYIEMIPLLVQKIQELSAEVDELKKLIMEQ